MPKFSLDVNYEILDSDDFTREADILLNQTYLKINDHSYRLVEIEFYLKNIYHPDLYVHSNPEQLLKNKFYFHRFGNGTYKAGTFKGMDITFGDTDTDTYFGILIRAILDTETDKLIEGPCNVVNHILSKYDCDSIMALTKNSALSIQKNKLDFVLRRTAQFVPEPLYVGPRIGLSEKYEVFQTQPYRYVIFRNRIKKQKTKLLEL